MIATLFAMFVLVSLVMGLMLIARVTALRAKKVKMSQFCLMELDGAPKFVSRTSRCFINLFEMPVFFYIAVLLLLQFNLETSYTLILAWCFVGFRALHAAIFIAYNNVQHRLVAFAIANTFLVLLWIEIARKLVF